VSEAALQAIAEPRRRAILKLVRDKPHSVNEIAEHFDVTQQAVSQHLKVLREAGLVDCERRGTWVHYWVVPAKLAALSQLLDVSTVAAGATT